MTLHQDTPRRSVPYVCADCGTGGVRLYRLWNTFLDHQHLRCTACAEKHTGARVDPEHPDQCDSLCAAVPSGDTFWGFFSVPDDAVKWWRALPAALPEGCL